MDGCSVFGSFLRVVLRNSLPGILSTAIFTFLLSWNDYLVAVVFLRSSRTTPCRSVSRASSSRTRPTGAR